MNSIAPMEPMEPIPNVIAAAIWGPKWAGHTVRSNCDNEAVVSVINSGHCKHKLTMHLVKCFLFIVFYFFIYFHTGSKAHPWNFKYTSGCTLMQQTRTVLPPHSPGQTLCYTHPTQPTSGPGPQEARLDFTGLDSLVHHYFQCSLAPSTQWAYMCGKKRYLSFCLCNNTSPLPVVECTLCYFIATLAQEGLTHQTIRSYLRAVKHLSIELQGTDPSQSSLLRLKHVLRGIKSEEAKRFPKPRTHLPITPSILHSI